MLFIYIINKFLTIILTSFFMQCGKSFLALNLSLTVFFLIFDDAIAESSIVTCKAVSSDELKYFRKTTCTATNTG